MITNHGPHVAVLSMQGVWRDEKVLAVGDCVPVRGEYTASVPEAIGAN